MDFICLLISLSSNPLHVSSSDVASNTFGFTAVLLVCLKLLLYRDTGISCRWCCKDPTHSPSIDGIIIMWTLGILSLPYLQSLRLSRSYHSCHQRKKRRSPWEPAGRCESSSSSSWWMEVDGPPVSINDKSTWVIFTSSNTKCTPLNQGGFCLHWTTLKHGGRWFINYRYLRILIKTPTLEYLIRLCKHQIILNEYWFLQVILLQVIINKK